MSKVKVLIVGASGMLGHAIIRLLNDDVEQFEVIGTLRGTDTSLYAENMHRVHFCENVDVLTTTPLNTVFQIHEPDVVINCVGLIKQRPNAEDPIEAINLNALFPHRLAQMCNRFGARLIQISTDCVFSGKSGRYSEEDTPDAIDFYGRSKLLGEVTYGNAVTLRTSIIGHELYRRDSLLEWFLSQSLPINGYSKAIFSGLPTVVLAGVIRDKVIPNVGLKGLFHVSAEPIDKYRLLKLIGEVYEHDIEINRHEGVRIDRSLDSTKFRKLTGFEPANWRQMIIDMRDFSNPTLPRF